MTNTSVNSSTLSITKWAYRKNSTISPRDWNITITTFENADLLLTLASDQNCPQRAFILHCLYSLVGTSLSKHVADEMVKIQELLNKAESSSDGVILKWVNRSRMIVRDFRKYIYVEWCQGGFSKQDLPLALV